MFTASPGAKSSPSVTHIDRLTPMRASSSAVDGVEDASADRTARSASTRARRDPERGHDRVPGDLLDRPAVRLDAERDALEVRVTRRRTTAGRARRRARDREIAKMNVRDCAPCCNLKTATPHGDAGPMAIRLRVDNVVRRTRGENASPAARAGPDRRNARRRRCGALDPGRRYGILKDERPSASSRPEGVHGGTKRALP